jgi:hypothetical protein
MMNQALFGIFVALNSSDAYVFSNTTSKILSSYEDLVITP